jgi:DNA-binding response OmpR family regulator
MNDTSHTHQQSQGEARRLFCGGAMLDLDAKQLMLRAKPIGLSRLECRAIRALFEAQGGIVSADALFAAIWPETEFSASNLRGLVGRLRQKLEPGCIETIGREGYAWVGRAAAAVSRVQY